MRLPLIRHAPAWAFTAHLHASGYSPLCAVSNGIDPVFIDVSGSRSRSKSLAVEITVAQEVEGMSCGVICPSQFAATRYGVVRKLSLRYLYYIWGVVLLRYGIYI